LIGRVISMMKNRKGVEHYAFDILIAIGNDSFGEEYLNSAGVNQLVVGLVANYLQNNNRAQSWLQAKSKESKLLSYIIKLSQYPNSAKQFKDLGLGEILTKLFGLSTKVTLEASLAVINIEGRGNSSCILLFNIVIVS